VGLTSRDGIVPLFINNDMGGPMARTVEDVATVLNVLVDYDPNDPATELLKQKYPIIHRGHEYAPDYPDYTKSLDKNGLRGARIGVFREYIDDPQTDPQIKALTEKAIADLKAQGVEIVDPFVIPDFKKLTDDIWCGDFQADLNSFLATHGKNAPYHTLADIVQSGLYLPYIQEDLNGSLHPKPGTGENAGPCLDLYHHPLKIKFRNTVLAAMDKDRLDAVVYPTWSNPPRKVGDLKSPAGDNSQILSPQTGFPAITVPMGFSYGALPAGLTILGRAFTEPMLIKFAYAYEQATHHRRPPEKFPPLR